MAAPRNGSSGGPALLSRLWTGFRWLPVLVALLAVALSIAGWSHLVVEREDQIRMMASDVAAQSRRTVATNVRNHLQALRNLAGFWAAVGRRPVEEWRADAEILIENFPDLDYIAWIHPDGRQARVAAGRFESTAGVEIEPALAQVLGRKARLLGPEPGAGGTHTFRVMLPVRRGEADLGVLEARIDVGKLLAGALAESAPGYAIRIHWGEQEVYARGEPSKESASGWWTQQGSVALPLETTWTTLHAPTEELVAAWLDPAPHYLLAVGILLSLALGVLSHHLRLNFLRARSLEAGNVALEADAGELRRLNEELEARVRYRTKELETFTHSISHDLKSPLGAILNFAAILELDYRNRPLDEEGLDLLSRIRTSAARGGELLEGLLRLTRAGRADLRVVPIDMTELAAESFAMARQSDLDPDVEFVLEPLPGARGDRALVREALINLLDNALKYSRTREKRRVSVCGRVVDGECIYEIEDNGQGFDMRFGAKLFGLFQRLPSSSGVEGTGVGLALVARIIDRHRGRVWAEGRVGEGARFVFTLPAEGGAP